MSPRKQRLFLVLLLAGLVLLWAVVPAPDEWMLPCPLFRLTGLRCPFCGSQRLVVGLLHGRPAEALGQNPGLLIVLPWAVAGGLRTLFPAFCRRHPRQTGAVLLSSRGLFLLAGLLVIWGVVRNGYGR